MAQGNVEVWLGSLQTVSQRSLHGIIRQAYVAINDENFKLMEFLGTFPAQVCSKQHIPSTLEYFLLKIRSDS